MKAIVVILDSLRRDHVGCYGASSIHTPSLDQFSRESIQFSNPKPEALATLQTRRAVHTGNRVFPFGDHRSYKGDINRAPGWGPHSEDVVTMAEIARHGGFHTGLITDTYHQFKPSMNFHRGFDQFHWIRGQENDHWGSVQLVDRDTVEAHSYPAQHNEFRRIRFRRYLSNVARRHYETDYFAPQVFSEAMRFIEDNRERDFLLVVDSFDPHEPWDPPWWYVDRYAPGYRGTDLIWPTYGACEGLDQAQIDLIRALYAGEVTMTDRWLGAFLEHCHCLGIMDETLLVVFSDHGHSLGEHGVMGKLPHSSYPELIDIIMMVRPPGSATADPAATRSFTRTTSRRPCWPTLACRRPARSMARTCSKLPPAACRGASTRSPGTTTTLLTPTPITGTFPITSAPTSTCTPFGRTRIAAEIWLPKTPPAATDSSQYAAATPAGNFPKSHLSSCAGRDPGMKWSRPAA